MSDLYMYKLKGTNVIKIAATTYTSIHSYLSQPFCSWLFIKMCFNCVCTLFTYL